jgi:hypothetical protein
MFHYIPYFFFCTAAATAINKIGADWQRYILDGIAPIKRMIFNFYNLNSMVLVCAKQLFYITALFAR